MKFSTDTILEREKMLERNKYHRVRCNDIANILKDFIGNQAKVLEIGCGTGSFAKYISSYVHFYVGVDVEQRFVRRRSGLNVVFVQADGQNLCFPDETFDAVLAIEVIEHVRDDWQLIKEALRVLKLNGILLLTTPNRLRLTSRIRSLLGKPIRFPHRYGVDPVHGDVLRLREYSYEELMQLLVSFNVSFVQIKGIWLDIPSLQLGVAHPPLCLKKLCFDWLAIVRK